MTEALPRIAVVGGGPAGLMAAEVVAEAGVAVDVYDAMPSPGRKFLLAGRGGLNLTHDEAFADFVDRYGARRAELEPLLEAFGPRQVRDWAHSLGIETFVGSSRRVFPAGMLAAPLLRAWLHRLRAHGVRLHARHRWQGLTGDGRTLEFATQEGTTRVDADAVVLAFGGGSWARLGSDGRWVDSLAARGVEIAPLKPANCGFNVAWSDYLRQRFAGQPVKNVAAHCVGDDGVIRSAKGELMLTDDGVEGGLVYALSAPLRDAIERDGQAVLHLDLLPDHDATRVAAEAAHPRGSRSLASHLKSRLGLAGVKLALLHEALPAEALADPQRLADGIKALPLTLLSARPLDEAISSAGGVRFSEVDGSLMLRRLPGIFCAGEMLDWEAPTGGYLLTACLSTGRAAGAGALEWLHRQRHAATIR